MNVQATGRERYCRLEQDTEVDERCYVLLTNDLQKVARAAGETVIENSRPRL